MRHVPPTLIYAAAEFITAALALAVLVAYDHWHHTKVNRRLENWRRKRDKK